MDITFPHSTICTVRDFLYHHAKKRTADSEISESAVLLIMIYLLATSDMQKA